MEERKTVDVSTAAISQVAEYISILERGGMESIKELSGAWGVVIMLRLDRAVIDAKREMEA